MVLEGKTTSLKTPIDISRKLHYLANKALLKLKDLSSGENKKLQFALTDIKAVSFLGGKYNVHKIASSTHLALYRKSKNKKYKQAAAEDLTKASAFFRKYTNQTLDKIKTLYEQKRRNNGLEIDY